MAEGGTRSARTEGSRTAADRPPPRVCRWNPPPGTGRKPAASGRAALAGAAAAFAILASLSVPPARAEAPPCPAGAERYAEYRLFFGRNREGVEVVSDAGWRAFLAEEITPRFPDGLTVIDAAGQWRAPSGTLERERTKILLVLARPGAESMRHTGEVAEAYKRTFGKEAVLRTVGSACASFL